MRKVKRWTLFALVMIVLATHAAAVAPFKKVSIATSTTTTTTTSSTPTTEATAEVVEAKSENVTSSGPTKNPKLTGIPQIDYIWDPNLPRELRGANLSNYPFYATVPPEEDIHFKCDGLHDGFYASIEHKCQVYHHCVYGIRHDFLCANFTAFDQKTFICHFVSDIDCEGSQKYWNRNDNLYMATTTTSTTTTTTEPPPTQRRRPVRPFRPLRRPMNRRPLDDYYYDDEEYTDDDYYEERLSQRRKQRPRHRKPQVDYDDDYDEKRAFSDEEKPRRFNSRDRYRDPEPDAIDDYDIDRRKHDRPKARNKANTPAERRKTITRRPATVLGRAGADERRSFGDERPVNGRKDKVRPSLDEVTDAVDTIPRRGIVSSARRRPFDKRPLPTAASAADIDDLDYYEKPNAQPHDQEEAADEEAPPKVKTTPKPLEEFVTPKASSSSMYARPRAPPRIARPVPVTEKKKFEYAVQKTTATTPSSAAAHSDPEDFEEYDEYEEAPVVRPHATAGRRRVVDDSSSKSDNDFPTLRRRTHNDSPVVGRKPSRTVIRKPITEKKPAAVADDDYDSSSYASNERPEAPAARPIISSRKRPYSSSSRTRVPSRGSDDLDFVDDDYEEHHPLRPSAYPHRSRPKTLARKSPSKSRLNVHDDVDLYETEPEPEPPVRSRLGGIKKSPASSSNRLRQSTHKDSIQSHDDNSKLDSATSDEHDSAALSSKASSPTAAPLSSGRPASVRVVKRPFLPSRGGSPYLPRGLQPVGIAYRQIGNAQTTDSTPIDMGSTISGVHLLEHGAPILRDSGNERDIDPDTDTDIDSDSDTDIDTEIETEPEPEPETEQEPEHEPEPEPGQTTPRTTALPPRNAIPVASQAQVRTEPQLNKAILDELYETDYDVTLNDALNPTLKPLSPHPNHHHLQSNRNYASAYASSSHQGATNPFVNNNNNNNNNNNQQQHPQKIYHTSNNSNNNNNNRNQNTYQQHQIAYQTLSSAPSSSSSSSSLSSSSSSLSSHQSQHHQYQLHDQKHASQQQQQQHQPYHQQHQQQLLLQQPQQQQHQPRPNNYNSDSYFSSTDIRRRAIIVPAPAAHSIRSPSQYRGINSNSNSRIAQQIYDDFDY